MKKQIVLIAAVFIAVVIGFAVSARETKAERASRGCPNGCLVDVDRGCWCNGWHPNVKEKNWGR
ncbi:MAG: hypothetical protein MI739_11970 [Bacteroidales bacterium]|nr:hypothetical protein [Bacteroidales bacterium]